MRFGLFLPPQTPLGQVPAIARRAEDLGYDFLACGEHVFFHAPTPNGLVALAAAAGATERIRLLSALTLLPTYPAALAAKMIATLDGVSGGRFEFGVGVGGEYPSEFAAVGVVEASRRGAYTDEALEVITALFTGEPVRHSGPFITIDGERLNPPPVQRPGPPIWLGGRRPAAMRRAGRFADVWLPIFCDPEQLRASLAGARAHAVEAGRDAKAVAGAFFGWGGVHPEPGRARRVGLEVLAGLYNQDLTRVADRYLVFGTPQEVIARYAEYVDAGAQTLLFAPACPFDEADAAMELFMTEVAPALRDRA